MPATISTGHPVLFHRPPVQVAGGKCTTPLATSRRPVESVPLHRPPEQVACGRELGGWWKWWPAFVWFTLNSIGQFNSIEIQNGLLKSIEIEFNSNWLIRKAVNYLKTGQTSFTKLVKPVQQNWSDLIKLYFLVNQFRMGKLERMSTVFENMLNQGFSGSCRSVSVSVCRSVCKSDFQALKITFTCMY